jgi:hypothetical protein
MALLDLTTDRSTLAFIKHLPPCLRHKAWAAANPPLAAEAELWRAEPRRAARCSADTVIEALEHNDDIIVVDLIHDTDRRTNVRNASYQRRRELKHLQDYPETATAVPRVTSNTLTRSEDETLAVLNNPCLETVAYNLFRDSYRMDEQTVSEWVKALSDERFEALVTAQRANSYFPVLEEIVRRGYFDQIVNNTALNRRTLVEAMSRHIVIDADLATQLIAKGLHTSMWNAVPWTAEALVELKKAREYVTLLHMREISMDEIVESANGLSLDEISNLLRVGPTARELAVLHDEVLVAASKGGMLPGSIIEAYFNKPMTSPELQHLLLLNSEPRAIVGALRKKSFEEQQQFLHEFNTLRSDAFLMLLIAIGQEVRTEATVALMWQVCQFLTKPVSAVSSMSGWPVEEFVKQLTVELEETDWKTFFKLMSDFSGSLDELISTIKALR